MNRVNSINRIISFDILRIVAAFAVVLLHISADRFTSSFPSYEWEIKNIYDSLVRWSVPVFVMISGALFLNQEKRINLRRLYAKNILRIILIFFIWSFLYALYDSYIERNINAIDIIRLTIKGPTHLWFLKMLLGLYIAIPVLRLISSNKRIEEYFIVLAIITAFVIPMIITFIGLYSEALKESALEYFNTIGIRIASGYAGYFVLGHYLSSYHLNKKLKKLIYVLGIISVLCVIFLTSSYSHYIKAPSVVFYGNLNLFTLLESLTVFLVICDLKISSNLNNRIIRISNLSLGVYLIHVLVFRLAYDLFGINPSSFNPVYYIPCFSLIVFAISCMIVAILIRVPILKKVVS